MAAKNGRSRGGRRFVVNVHKPHGIIQPRVQKVGPEHFGIVSVDCAKARFKWMLCDFYGKVLIPPTTVEHNGPELDRALAQLKAARLEHELGDLIVAVERTGRYHHIPQRHFAAHGYEVRLVHPFTSKQHRTTTDPGNKTDDIDLAAIHRAAVSGCALAQSPIDPVYRELQLLIRQRRDWVRKTSMLCCQIREYLHSAYPGYPTCWSPDDRQIVVVNPGDEDNSLEHFLVDVNSKVQKAISFPKVEAPEGAKGRIGHLITDLSRDGQWFLTTCYRGDKEKPHLYLVKCDGSQAVRVKGAIAGEWGRFSPDGKRILFVGPADKGQLAAMVTGVDDGSKAIRVSPEENGSIDPMGFSWSPDGKRVAYLWRGSATRTPAYGEEYESFLIVIDADGRNHDTVFSEKTKTIVPIHYAQWR